MEKREILQNAIQEIVALCGKMIKHENYQQELPACIQAINNACMMLLQDNRETEEIISLLEDIMYGMSQKDEIFLLDVLRFGLKPKLEDIDMELENNQPEGIYE